MTTKGQSGPKELPTKRHAFDAKYDFEYRPETYWPDLPSERTSLSTIEGTARRDIARRALEGEELPRLGSDELYRGAMEFVLEEKLDDAARERWGAVHPAMMGGEYLPDREEDEVEIARIELASTTGDVLQVRARPTTSGIAYQVVDEYWDEGSRWAVTPKSSGSPLTLGELVELIDTAHQAAEEHIDPEHNDAGLVDPHWEYVYAGEGNARAALTFVRVDSLFYPQLGGYYNERAWAWYEAIQLERLDEKIEGQLEPTRRRQLVRPVSPAKYSPPTPLVPSRRGMRSSGAREEGRPVSAVVVGVFVSNVPEALSGTSGLLEAGWTGWRVFALWSKVVAVSVVAAAVGWGLLDVIGTGGGAFALAFAGGALLVMLADTLIPEAFDLGGREAGLLTALGFALGFALS